MLSSLSEPTRSRGILFAPHELDFEVEWWRGVDDVFRPIGLAPVFAESSAEAIAWVERGGLAAAIVTRDRSRGDGLTLLRIIRSIDGNLPCWLVTNDPSRATLEAAFLLRTTCVLRSPPTPAGLALAARRLLSERS